MQTKRNELIIENQNLIYAMLKKLNLYHNCEEYFSIGMFGLIKGVDTYEESKGIKLSSYLCVCIKNELCSYLRTMNFKKRKANLVSLDQSLYTDQNGNIVTIEESLASDVSIEDDYEKKLLFEQIELIYSKLSYKERFVLDYKFGLHNNDILSQKEIADRLNLSQPEICRTLKKVIIKMKEEMSVCV